MIKTFTAAITALALTLAAPAPALAQNQQGEDFAKIILGLIALGAIANAVDDHRDDRRDRAEVRRDHRPQFGVQRRDRGGFVAPQNPRRSERFGTPRRNPHALPARCLVEAETRYGTQRFFARRCLERNFAGFAELPRACSVRLITHRGPRAGFDPHCLRDRGYRRARH